MRFAERVRAWLHREAAEAADVVDDATERLEAEVARRERELAATPEERIELLAAEMEANDAALEQLRRRVERPDGKA